MIVRELISLLGYKVDEKGLRDNERAVAASTRRTSRIFETAAGFILAQLSAAVGGGLVRMVDEWASVDARVKLATKSVAEHTEAMEGLFGIAQATRASFTATAELFASVARSSEELGVNQAQLLQLTEDINRALAIGGAGAGQASAAILQLSQALASGRLQGDEFRSLMENAPRLMRAIADGMGKPYGELRKMAQQGLLTADAVVQALLKQSDVLRREFETAPLTISQAFTVAGNELSKLVYETGKAANAFSGAARSIVWTAQLLVRGLRRIIDLLGGAANAAKVLAVALAAVLIPTLVAASRALWRFFAAQVVGFWPLALIAGLILLLEDLYQWVQGHGSVIGDLIGDFENWRRWFVELAEPVRTFAKWLESQIEGVGAALGEGLSGAMDALGRAAVYVGQVWTNSISDISSAWASLRAGFEGGLDWIGERFERLVGMIRAIPDAFSRARDAVSGFFQLLRDGLLSMPDWVMRQFGLGSEGAAGSLGGMAVTPGALLPPAGPGAGATINNETTINITTRDDPAAVAAAAERGTRRGASPMQTDLSRMLDAFSRQVQRAAPGAEVPAAAY